MFVPGRREERIPKNTTTVSQDIEVYSHQIFELVDQYIQEELAGDTERVTEYFTDLILYIGDNIPKPSNDDIELLDNLFNIYKRLCTKYKVLPTLECFSFMVNINRITFTDWLNGDYRLGSQHGNTVKKWKDICQSFLVNSLTNSRGTDANKIFIAKAAYGMAETAPVQTQTQIGQIRSSSELLEDMRKLQGNILEVSVTDGK